MSILVTIGAICSAVISVCTAVTAVCRVAETVIDLGKATGVIENNGNHEEIGVRCLAAESMGITPETFNNDYSRYLREVNSLDLSGIDGSSWTAEEKALKAIEVVSAAIINEIGPGAEKAILAIANHPESDFYTAERMKNMIDAQASGAIDMDNALAYMDGRDASAAEARQDLVKVEKLLDPDISDEEALDFVDLNR